MSVERLETLRARFASGKLVERFGSLVELTEELKKYRSAALNAPAYLRQCGILQLAAFYASKEDLNPLLEDIWEWLCQSPLTSRLLGSASREVASIVGELANKNNTELALLEQEAEAIILWLKRLAEARYRSLKPPETGQEKAQPGEEE